jgi:arginase
MTSKFSLIPYVSGAGASVPGSEFGAIYAYDHGLQQDLQRMGIDASWQASPHDYWNSPQGEEAHKHIGPRGSPERLATVRHHNQLLADNAARAIKAGNRVLTIGGDHSLAAGSLAGARMALGADKKVGLIWVDAHPDIQTYATSVSKALHGTPMATLLGLDDTLAIKDAAYPVFTPATLVYTGLRSIDAEEIDNAALLGLALVHLNETRKNGLTQTVTAQVAELARTCDHILISMDLDSFSGALAPAVGSPVDDGFLREEILPILRHLIDTHSVPLIDLVEFNPTLPGAEKTYAFMLEIYKALLA